MRFQVPQNLDIPDTIFFGMSFKQLLYIGGGVGFLFLLYLVTGNLIITLLFGAPVCIIAGLLAFFRLNNQPFIVIMQSMMQFVTRKRMYVWKQESNAAYTQRKVGKKKVREDSSAEQGEKDRRIQDLGSHLMFDDDPLSGQEPDIAL